MSYSTNLEWRRRYREERRGSIRFFIQEHISTWRAKPGPASDLTVDYLVGVYSGQEGKCFYSGEAMIFNARVGKPLPNSLSLDRLDPEFGYTKGNVVWCCYFINTMKGRLGFHQFFNLMEKMILLAGD